MTTDSETGGETQAEPDRAGLFVMQKRDPGVSKIVMLWNVALVVFVACLDLSPLVAGLVAGVLSVGFSVIVELILRRRRRKA